MAKRFECKRCAATSDYPLTVEVEREICFHCHDIEINAQPVCYSED